MLLSMHDSCLIMCYDGCHADALIPAYNHAVHAVTTVQHATHAGQICYIMFQIATACCNFTIFCTIDGKIMLSCRNFSTSWYQSDLGSACAVCDVIMLHVAAACPNSDSMFKWMNIFCQDADMMASELATRPFPPCGL
jgi:hypothetical protein